MSSESENTIRTQCPSCGARMELQDTKKSRKLICGYCGREEIIKEHAPEASRPAAVNQVNITINNAPKQQNENAENTEIDPKALVPVNVSVNGNKLSKQGLLVNGQALVPMRAVLESLGVSVKWDGAAKTVTAANEKSEIIFTIGNSIVYINGTAKKLSVPAALVNGSAMLPLRLLSDAFEASIKWDGASKTAYITGKKA